MFKLTIMKKILIINAFLAFFLIFPMFSVAQNAIKIRLSGNSTTFRGEPRGDEVIFPMIENILEGDTTLAGFSNKGNLGLSGEVMLSLSSKAWVGLELSSSNFSGVNYNPPLYNFQYTDDNQLQVRVLDIEEIIPIQEIQYPLEYNTSMINLLVNFRYYLAGEGRFLPFVKVHSGMSFIATELAFQNEAAWPPQGYVVFVNNQIQPSENLDFGAPILYSRGTDSSTEGRVAALNYGIGFGFEIQINEKINFYADYTMSRVNLNILDGRPNYDYNELTGELVPFNTLGSLGQFSFGLCYKLGQNVNLIGGGGGGSKGGGKTGRQHPYLPFYEIKREK
jgi:hypothetical protein